MARALGMNPNKFYKLDNADQESLEAAVACFHRASFRKRFNKDRPGVVLSIECYDDVLSVVAEVRDRSCREPRIADAFPRGVHDPGLRTLLRGELCEYQCEGALSRRAPAADSSATRGLDKTIQSLAAAEIMTRQLGFERVLIVRPTTGSRRPASTSDARNFGAASESFAPIGTVRRGCPACFGSSRNAQLICVREIVGPAVAGRREWALRFSRARPSCTLAREGYIMIRTVEAVIDEDGNVRLLEPVCPPTARRALVTILEEGPVAQVSESALLSEEALAQDWNRPEEDEAWSHIQPEQ